MASGLRTIVGAELGEALVSKIILYSEARKRKKVVKKSKVK